MQQGLRAVPLSGPPAVPEDGAAGHEHAHQKDERQQRVRGPFTSVLLSTNASADAAVARLRPGNRAAAVTVGQPLRGKPLGTCYA
jgi:hypothetical protein